MNSQTDSIEGSGGRDKEPGHPAIVDNSAEHRYLDVPEPGPDARPAAERLDSLVEGMPGQRDVLLGILRSCDEPRADGDVLRAVGELQASNRSVYEAHTLCRLLEQAGGLVHVLPDGSAFRAEDYRPVVVAEGGEEFIQAAEPPASCWVATPEGLAYAAADDPVGRTRAMLAEEAADAVLFKYLLKACQGGGSKTKALEAVVEAHPLAQEPKRYVQHFLKLLEDAGALAWKGAWVTTPAGSAALAALADVEDIA